MYKHAIIVIALIFVSGHTLANTRQNTQSWECAIDLHQGDRGTLSMQRNSDKITGLINVVRNGRTFKSDISGTWVNNEVNIKRLLDSSSSEPMAGIAVDIGTKKVSIGGRYSDSFQGVWSADCDLVVNASATKSTSNDVTSAVTVPSTSSRISPSRPTQHDRIKFSAIASHPDGIQTISFFLGNKQIHTCEGVTCEVSYGPLSEGKYQWRVEALSESGVKSTQRDNFEVKFGQSIGQCNISGKATGSAAELSSIYSVKLFGPNNQSQLKESSDLSGGRYQFSNLPQGKYLLKVDTNSDRGVLVTPAATMINCKTGGNMTQNFKFD